MEALSFIFHTKDTDELVIAMRRWQRRGYGPNNVPMDVSLITDQPAMAEVSRNVNTCGERIWRRQGDG